MGEANATEQRMSPTRTRASWKPGVSSHPLPFFRCTECHAVLCAVDDAADLRIDRSLRREDATLPFAGNAFAPSCCGRIMERLEPLPDGQRAGFSIGYEVVGGVDANALRVRWSSTSAHPLRWVALKTVTGVQLKYVLPGKKPPLVFAFADEDAYAYCNEDPCRACTFRCKRGFHLYAYLDGLGLIDQAVHAETLRT